MSKQEQDLWQQLVDEAGEDEIDRAASVSVQQAEAELAAAGFDVAAERAKANAFLDALAGGRFEEPQPEAAPEAAAPAPTTAVVAVAREQAPPRARRDRGRPRPVVMWLAAAATVTVAGGALYAALQPSPAPMRVSPEPPPTTPRPIPSPVPDLAAAADLRRQAAAACDAQEWSLCLAKLNEARAGDPDGDATPAVKVARDRATRGLAGKPRPSQGPPPG